MSGTYGRSFAELDIYQLYESLSDRLWDTVESWDFKYQKRIGDQMLDAVDSIGANIAESIGRGHVRDGCRFLFFARGSLHETEHWIRVTKRRKLIANGVLTGLREDFVILAKKLNAFIRKQRPPDNGASRAREGLAEYGLLVSVDNPVCRKSRPRCQARRGKSKSQEPRASSQEQGA